MDGGKLRDVLCVAVNQTTGETDVLTKPWISAVYLSINSIIISAVETRSFCGGKFAYTHHVARQQMNMHSMGGMATNDDLYQFTADDIAF